MVHGSGGAEQRFRPSFVSYSKWKRMSDAQKDAAMAAAASEEASNADRAREARRSHAQEAARRARALGASSSKAVSTPPAAVPAMPRSRLPADVHREAGSGAAAKDTSKRMPNKEVGTGKETAQESRLLDSLTKTMGSVKRKSMAERVREAKAAKQKAATSGKKKSVAAASDKVVGVEREDRGSSSVQDAAASSSRAMPPVSPATDGEDQVLRKRSAAASAERASRKKAEQAEVDRARRKASERAAREAEEARAASRAADRVRARLTDDEEITPVERPYTAPVPREQTFADRHRSSRSARHRRHLDVGPESFTREREPEVMVEAVMYGDGRKMSDGRTMLSDTVYGSSRADAGHEGFAPIDFTSLKLDLAGMGKMGDGETFAGSWRVGNVPGSSQELPDKPDKLDVDDSTRRKGPSHVRSLLRGQVGEWMLDNPGVPLVIARPGSRAGESRLIPFRDVEGGRVRYRQAGRCLRNALLNALGAFDGSEAARNMSSKMKDEASEEVGLKSVGVLMSVRGGMYTSEKLKPVEHAEYIADPFGFLVRQRSGVFVVRLSEHGRVDHVVAVDCGRRRILDSEEEYPLVFTEESLRLCGGPSATGKLRVREVRKMGRKKVG